MSEHEAGRAPTEASDAGPVPVRQPTGPGPQGVLAVPGPRPIPQTAAERRAKSVEIGKAAGDHDRERRLRKSARIVDHALDAVMIEDDRPIFDDEGKVVGLEPPPKPRKWTDTHFRAARDARKATKDMPGYLKLAHAELDQERRIEAGRPTIGTLNVAIMLPPIEHPREDQIVYIDANDEVKQ